MDFVLTATILVPRVLVCCMIQYVVCTVMLIPLIMHYSPFDVRA